MVPPDDPGQPGDPQIGSPRPYVPRLLLQRLATAPQERCWTVDGSVVFVDISGFTKLSERLARHGKEGAEQVTEAIEGCFTSLLAVAYSNGGGLIKFGGDALLLLFEGDDHAARAARSAVWMRRTLREVGRIDLPGARVQLRMSVGMHSGTFHFFLVGDSHRELLPTGPAWTRTVEMEHEASAGEILLSPESAALLPPRCSGKVKGPGFLLVREPPGLERGLEAVGPDPDDAGAEIGLSVAVREHVLGGGGAPEHRPVTIAFVHFDGIDEMLEAEGPRAVADGLHELVSRVQAAVDEQGICFLASDADADGGKLILTAGAPRVSGNDEERMLLALRRIVDPLPSIPVRIGVNRGGVFAGDIGPWYRRTYTVMGDAVNLSARLMAAAPPGEIWATADVLDRSNTRFDTRELEPFSVKGKAHPVRAWAVGEPLRARRPGSDEDARAGGSHARLPLIGRDAEMSEISAALDDARGGSGLLLELVGEPGIGKTRLSVELRARAGDFRTFHATAEAYRATSPYAVWRELMRDMLDLGWEDPDDVVLSRLLDVVSEVDPDLMPWLPLLAVPLDVDVRDTLEVELLAPEFRRAKLQEVVGRLLERILTSPALIEIEDAHLMDPASVDLLTSLIDDLVARPWLIVVTRRDEQPAGFVAPDVPHVLVVTLAPLTGEQALSLAKVATESDPLLPHDLGLVATRSAGNPQFLLDLVHAIGVGSMLPESVEAAAMATIDQLDPVDRAIVRRASVLGVSFHPRFLEDVLDDGMALPTDETWARLDEFFEDDGDGYLRFRRAIVRDSAYTGLPFRLRRRLHAALGERLEHELTEAAEEDVGILSMHFFLAGVYPKAWTYARTAAEHATAQFANQEAAYLYRRAIDAGRRMGGLPDRETARMYEALGDVLGRAGEYVRAAEAYASARRLVPDEPVVAARLMYRRSGIEDKLGRYSEALRWATRARRRLEGVEGVEADGQRAKLSAFTATVLIAQGRTAEAVGWSRRAIEEAEASGDRDALARGYNVMDWSSMLLGRPSGEYWHMALRIYEELGDLQGQARVLSNLAGPAYYDGRWDQAVEFWTRGREIELTIGDPVGAATDAVNMAEVLSDQGRYGEAEALFRESIPLWRASGSQHALGFCLGALGRIATRTGRFEEALPLFEEARAELLAIGAQSDVLELEAKVAECYVSMGETAQALSIAGEALAKVASTEGVSVAAAPLLRVKAYALMQSGDLEGARVALEESLQASRARGADSETALTLMALARLARLEGSSLSDQGGSESDAILLRLKVIAVPAIPLSVAAHA